MTVNLQTAGRVSRDFLLCLLTALLLAACGAPAKAPPEIEQDLIRLVQRLSEEPGYFDTDNLISNEASYQQIIPAYQDRVKPGGVYIGVGPDQNYTYIAHSRPQLALIVDIRRDNLLVHLYFKELFRISRDRWEYLSHLFGKPLDSSIRRSPSGANEIVSRFSDMQTDRDFFEDTFSEVWTQLLARYPGLVREDDYAKMLDIALPFHLENVNLRFRSHGRPARAYYPTFGQLIEERDLAGNEQSYLSREEYYQTLRKMQLENRIVPVVGNLAGSHSIREIGDYLRERGLTVSTLYVSNVEFYLFQEGSFPKYVRNVLGLPCDPDGVFIRTVFRYGRAHPETVPGALVTPLLQSIQVFRDTSLQEPYVSYHDLVTRDYIPVVGR